MAIYRPSYTRTLADGRQVRRKLRKYYLEYRDPATGERHRLPLCRDRKAALAMAADHLRLVERGRAGLIDPYAEPRARPLAEHLGEYLAHLAAKGGSARHPRETVRAIERFAEAAGVGTLAELCRERLETWIGEEHRGGRKRTVSYTRLWRGKSQTLHYDRPAGSGARAINYTLAALKGFTHWLEEAGRIERDPLRRLHRLNEQIDPKHPRRALVDEEFGRLLEATAAGKPFRGLSGADRAWLYAVAANTGFRRRALASLTPEAFDLTRGSPAVAIPAGLVKSKRAHGVPLPHALAPTLGAWLGTKPPGQTLWPGTWWEKSAVMLRRDLAAAGIPYLDGQGRAFDFHALRGQYATALARAGVHPRVAQALLGVSSIGLVMRHYTHMEEKDLRAAAELLPSAHRVQCDHSLP